MTWGAGFEPQLAKRRGYVTRMALFYLFWTLLSATLVILALFEMFTDDAGFLIMFGVFLPLLVLVGYQARQYIRDMRSSLVISEGEVMRKWDKSNPLEIPMLIFIVGIPLATFKLITDAELQLSYVLLYLVIGVLLAWRIVMPLIRDLITIANADGKGPAKVAGYALGFFFLPSFYMVVDQKIFSVGSEDYLHLLETDLVRVHHFPNSLTIEALERYDPTTKEYVRPDGASV